jgi:hypothetical protein
MLTSATNNQSVPLARQIACMVQNTCDAPPPAAPKGDFDKLLKQAQLLGDAGYGTRDAAINGFFKALNAATTFDQANQVLEALPVRGWAYRDVTFAALSACARRAETRDQAMTTATAALDRGHAFDNWAVGALDRALALSSKGSEYLEIANLARDHEHLGHFRGVQERAIAKLR